MDAKLNFFKSYFSLSIILFSDLLLKLIKLITGQVRNLFCFRCCPRCLQRLMVIEWCNQFCFHWHRKFRFARLN
jgi:hypothetical protein